MKKTAILVCLLIAPVLAFAGGSRTRTVSRTAYFPARPGSIPYQYPAPVIARGPVVQVISRTVYFPGGPGNDVVYRAGQGRGTYTGARTTRLYYGKRFLTPAEMNALRTKYRFPDRKFGVHKTWTITTLRKQAF